MANNVNRLRLGTERDYFNSGVLLIDLARCRAEVKPEEIFSYVSEHAEELLLPDQDILNALYSSRILELDDALWNYDARNFKNYLMRSNGGRRHGVGNREHGCTALLRPRKAVETGTTATVSACYTCTTNSSPAAPAGAGLISR